MSYDDPYSKKIAPKKNRDIMAQYGTTDYNYSMLHKPFTGAPSDYAYSEAKRLKMTIEAFMAKYDKPGAKRPKHD